MPALCVPTHGRADSRSRVLVAATNCLCVPEHARPAFFLRGCSLPTIPHQVHDNANVQLPHAQSYAVLARVGSSSRIPRQVHDNVYVQLPHAQSCGVLAGEDERYVDKNATVRTLHKQMCEFVAEHPRCELSMEVFEMSLKNAVSIFNAAAGEHWSKMFKLQVQKQSNNDQSMHFFLLQVVCAVHEEDDKCQPSILNTEHTVGACLQIQIQEGSRILPNGYIPNAYKANDALDGRDKIPTFYIKMYEGITVFCLRKMGLGTLLRACTLLAAQQFAFFGKEGQAVGFDGKAVSRGTKKIYKELFADILLKGNGYVNCTRLYASQGNTPPQSTQNVARMLWHWYGKHARLCTAPLASHISMHDDVNRKTALHCDDLVRAGSTSSEDSVAEHMHASMCKFVENMREQSPTTELFNVQHFEQALVSAVHIMNKRIQYNGCQAFEFSRTSETDLVTGLSRCFLQIVCVPIVESDLFETDIIPSTHSVAAQLELIVRTPPQNDKSVLEVQMKQTVTVFCLRRMHLCTLLHACALLAAQQFAYFGSETQTVFLAGTATDRYLEKIYAHVFADMQLERTTPGCELAYAKLSPSSQKAPQSLQNVAGMLSHAFLQSGCVYAAPVATQIEVQEPARSKPKP